jgi:hypothetical protein
MEGTNNLIKTLKRRAYGFRNINRFAQRIRLECREPKQAKTDSLPETMKIAV